MTLKMKRVQLLQWADDGTNPVVASIPEGVSSIHRSIAQAAVASVTEDNARRAQQLNDEIAAEGEGYKSEQVVAVERDEALPVELFEVERDGHVHYLVLLVTNSKWRTAYRLAVVTPTEVTLSGWEQYSSPIVLGPWIYFSEYFDNEATIGYAEWSAPNPRQVEARTINRQISH